MFDVGAAARFELVDARQCAIQVLALGAERAGIDPALDALSRGGVEVSVTTIPQDRRTESLNVSAAGAVLMGEALRQREVQGRGLV